MALDDKPVSTGPPVGGSPVESTPDSPGGSTMCNSDAPLVNRDGCKEDGNQLFKPSTNPLTIWAYLMLIGNMGLIALICTFYALSLDKTSSTDTALFLIITGMASILQNCFSETFKLYFEGGPSRSNINKIFHLLAACSAILAIAAPIIQRFARDGSERAPICVLCATLLLGVYGCFGALDSATRATAKHADREKAIADQATLESLREQLSICEVDLQHERQSHEVTRKEHLQQKKALKMLLRACSEASKRNGFLAKEGNRSEASLRRAGSADETWSIGSNDLNIMASAYDRQSGVPVDELLFNKR